MVATLEITQEEVQDIEIPCMPHAHESFFFDGIPYYVHKIRWEYTINDKDVKVYKPVILIHS